MGFSGGTLVVENLEARAKSEITRVLLLIDIG